MNTRFEVRLDGFGWPAIWDTTSGSFLPGRFPSVDAAQERAEMLNNGRAAIGTSAPPVARKTRSVDEEPTLF